MKKITKMAVKSTLLQHRLQNPTRRESSLLPISRWDETPSRRDLKCPV